MATSSRTPGKTARNAGTDKPAAAKARKRTEPAQAAKATTRARTAPVSTTTRKAAAKAPEKTAKTAAAKKSAAKKTVAKKAAAPPTKKAPVVRERKPAQKAAQKKTAHTSVGEKNVTDTMTGAGAETRTGAAAMRPQGDLRPAELRVRAGEEPWTKAELREVQAELNSEVARLKAEIALAESDIADLLRDSGEGAGDDQADTGTKNFEREHEMSLANNSREMLLQTERALVRLENGTYGVCESCGQPIGKARLQAFPRATLCVSCKQKEERR